MSLIMAFTKIAEDIRMKRILSFALLVLLPIAVCSAQSGQQEALDTSVFEIDDVPFFDDDRGNAIRDEMLPEFRYNPAREVVPDTMAPVQTEETDIRLATPETPSEDLVVILGAYPGGLAETTDIVAFYGHPRSDRMGILGEQSVEETVDLLQDVAAEWDRANGAREVLPAFHMVFATVFSEGDVGYMSRSYLNRYIDYAEENGVLVILDHQLGRHDVVESVETMLPYLHRDHVHLAIDPEWSTDKPGEEIGSVTAAEINAAQERISEYLIENDLPGPRILLVHQFNAVMIQDRWDVRNDFAGVELIHNADGFGTPEEKLSTYRYLAGFTNMPVKGFKLFYPKEWRDGGYDDPLMTAQEVLELDPRPVLIQYQ